MVLRPLQVLRPMIAAPKKLVCDRYNAVPLLIALLATPFASAAVSVRLSPLSPTVTTNGTQTFTAKTLGTNNPGIYWSVNGDPIGNSLLGTLSASGSTVVYTAPASPIRVTLYAWSLADPTKSATTVITVVGGGVTPPPVSVSVAPASTSVQTAATQQFSATVTNTTNTAVTWKVNGNAGGNSTVGTISSN